MAKLHKRAASRKGATLASIAPALPVRFAPCYPRPGCRPMKPNHHVRAVDAPHPKRPAVLVFALMFALFGLVPTGRTAEGRALLPTATPAPHAGSCNESCDHKASDCIDACEAQQKDDKARVTCKLACIGEREKCSKVCGASPTRATPLSMTAAVFGTPSGTSQGRRQITIGRLGGDPT